MRTRLLPRLKAQTLEADGEALRPGDLGLIPLIFPFLPASPRLPVCIKRVCSGNISWEDTGLFLEFAIWFLNVAVQQESTVGKERHMRG